MMMMMMVCRRWPAAEDRAGLRLFFGHTGKKGK
jgi:hypothetical protein